MTKRTTQTSTVAVPASTAHVQAAAAPVVAKAVVVPTEVEGTAKADVAVKGEVASVVVEAVVAAVAPAPLAMIDAASAEPAAAAAAQDDSSDDSDLTPYIVGGVLLAGGILAVALSSGDNNNNTPAPTPTPTPTNTVTFSSAATATIAENTAAGAGTGVVVIDVNAAAAATGGPVTFALGGTDASVFNINAATGEIRFNNSPDFETRSAYSVTVTASSAANGTTPAATATQTIAIAVTNVNEAPTFQTTTRAVSIAENSPITTPVLVNGAATDVDAGTTLTYSLTGADAALFLVNPATGGVTFRASPDFETRSTFTFNLVASDAATGGLSASQVVTVNVTDVNEAPTVTVPTTAVSFAENGAGTVFTATAADVDAGATRTLSLTGPDAALFTINQTTGAVTFVNAPNFEATPTKTSFNVSVVVTDQGGLSATSTPVTVNVTDVNEAPTVTVPTAPVAFAENTPTTTTVFTAASTDPDAGATRTLSLTGPDAASFTINQTTGAVTFVNSPNFEATPTKTTFTVSVVSTDQGGLAATSAPVTVSVTNVNEVPTFATTTRIAALDENVPAGTVVPGSAVATDPDAGGTLTYSLSGTDAARFAINGTSGVVTIVASPDFETKSSFSFNVVATDQGGLAATQAVTLNINDLPEGIILIGTQNLSAAGGNFAYIESAGSANTSTIGGFGNGDTITVDVPTGNYSFSNNGADLIISFSTGGVASLITLTGAVAPGSFVFNEFTAEQAVGSNFFLQNSSVPVPPASSNTIDGAGAVASYNAANSAVTFTESATAANTTTITNFGTDDRLVVTNLPAGSAGYSFSNNGADLIISFSNNGVASLITLQGAVSATSFVFNEASAEAAVGADFFRYG